VSQTVDYLACAYHREGVEEGNKFGKNKDRKIT